jgi:UDP-N-acetylmuramate--alanine ligase
MIDLKNIEGIYFVGIGGIGMSALALYFAQAGFRIAGYDRSESRITDNLSGAGCEIIYDDNAGLLPSLFKDISLKDKVTVIYTPAIPAENSILSFFRNKGYRLYKRAEVLGAISTGTDTIAIAGTHGKTTVSTMTAHLLKQSQVDCSAFLGGISKNYGSNLISGGGRFTVMEADEFDRSFLWLSPLMAVITAVDPDHLEVYGSHEAMIAAYNEFCGKIRSGGLLIVSERIRDKIVCPEGISCFTYGSSPDADYRCFNIVHRGDHYSFSLKTPDLMLDDLRFPFPGIVNIENLTAAAAIALNCGVSENEIRKAIILFQGVRRRFDIRVNRPGLAYVDDYAHHPEEIKACIESLREFFRGRRITGIFQPHLFTRTRDHAEGFARILDRLDEVIILPIYPAREKPIPGVSSGLILDKMKLAVRSLMQMEDLPGRLDVGRLDVLVTIGAGDIDKLADPIEKKLKEEGKG